MRTTGLKVALLATALLTAGQTLGQWTLEDSLQLYYPFDGNALDYSGNGINGTVSGASSTTDRFNNSASSYNFDGNDNVQTFTSFDYNYRTLSCWIKPHSITSSSSAAAAQIFFSQNSYQLTYGNLQGWFGSSTLKLRAGGSHLYTHNTTLDTNNWYHITVVRDGSSLRYYLNAELLTTASSGSGGSSSNANVNLVIGAGRAVTSQYFDGKIDEFRVYNRALKDWEIENLHCPVDASISIPDTLIQGETNLQFENDSHIVNVNYTWLMDGDTVSTDSAFNTTIILEGNHYIVLVVTDGYCTSYDTTMVHFLPVPTCLASNSTHKISATSGGFAGILSNDGLFGMGTSSYPDLNNDGIDELLVGVPRDDDGGQNRGALYFLYINDSGQVVNHQKISSDSGNLGSGIANDDEFGFSLDCIGDVNGDGINDLAVGAPGTDDGGSNRGAVWILFLDTNGFIASKQKISDTQGGLQEALSNTERLGLEVAGIGDLNNDGIPDIACGITTDYITTSGDGSVLILFLNANGTVADEVKLDRTSNHLSAILDDGDAFGQAIEAMGDYNGDGVLDFGMGFGQFDGGGTDRGAFALVSLDSTGSVTQAHRITEDEYGFSANLHDYGNFGSTLANLDDIDGDGFKELAVGNWRDNTGGSERGAVWVLSIDSSGYVFNTIKIDNNSASLNLDNGDRFGRSIANIGDFDNDGLNDLLIGARHDDDGGTDRGAVYLISLKDSCCQLVANFTSPSQQVCLGNSLTFTNNSSSVGSGATYQWYIGDSLVATAQNLNYIFNDAGNFVVKLVVLDSCTRSFEMIINVHPLPNADAGPSQFICQGDSIQLNASGGLHYQWSNGALLSNDTISNPFAFPGITTIFSVTVTSAQGCSDVDNLAIIVNTLPIVGVSGDSLVCAGMPTLLTATGALSYTWQPGASLSSTTGASVTATPLVNTQYIVEGTDANGCQDTATIDVLIDTSLSASIASIVNVSCFGASDGSATATVSGGTSPYSYAWTTGDTTLSVGTLVSGTYTLSVSDDEGCLDTLSVFIDQPDSITISATLSHVLCHGESNGAIAASVIGGTPGYTYLWSNGNTTANVSGLPAGTYTLSITDVNACTGEQNFTINQPAILTASAVSTANVLCNGGNSGTASASASGGTGPYAYLWSSGASGNTAGGLSAGTYTVSITDINGCTDTAQVSITEPATPLSSSISSISHVGCNGGNDGAASTTASGGTPPYSFVWSTGSTSANITGLVAGNYTVTTTDSNGCTATATAIITQPTQLVAAVGVNNHVSCFGGSDGSALASASGGTPPYSYTWPSGAITATENGLNAGSHTVTVTDAEGCVDTQAVLITEPPLLIATAALVNDVSCQGGNNGVVTGSATGGTTTYSFSWSSGGTSATETGLAAGTYTLTVSDAMGCTDTSSIVVDEPTLLVVGIDSVHHVLCNGGNSGEAFANSSGGTAPYTYLWSNASSGYMLAAASQGSYTVTATDNQGCTATASVTITEPLALSASAVQDNPVVCYGDSNGGATVSVSNGTPGYTYLWESGENTANATALWAGTRSVTVSDANGCTLSTSVTITQPTPVVATIDSTKDVICNGFYDGAAYTSASGGVGSHAFLWNTGDTTSSISSLTSGLYVLTVTDANGCTDSTQITIIELDPILPNVSNTHVTCYAGSNADAVSAMTGGGTSFDYLWSTGSTATSISGLAAGIYTLTITDENNCYGIDSAVVTQPDSIELAFNPTHVSCHGFADGSASVSATGGTIPYSYLWSTSSVDSVISGLATGNYSITITDSNGCQNHDSVFISEPSPLAASTWLIDSVTCHGLSDGTAYATATGGVGTYSFAWSNGSYSDTLNMVGAGTYTVTVSDTNACTYSTTVLIEEPAVLQISLIELVHVACFDSANGQIEVTYTGGNGTVDYLWEDASTTALRSGLDTGTFKVSITDFKGCQDSAQFTINQPDTAVHIATASIIDAYCHGGEVGSVTTQAAGGTAPYSYYWVNAQSSNTATWLGAGTYGVTITDSLGCVHDTSFAVSEPALPDSAVLVTSNITCFGDSNGSIAATFVGGITPFTYLWSNAETTSAIGGLAAGNYAVTVTDSVGCLQVAGDSVSEPDALTAVANITNPLLCHGDTNGAAALSVGGGTTPYSYMWNNGSINDSISGLNSGWYAAIITDANGCIDSAVVFMAQPSQITIDSIQIADVGCHGLSDGNIEIWTSGGTGAHTYLWNTGDTASIIDSMSSGNYALTITDAAACSTDSTLLIDQPDSLLVLALLIDSAHCSNSSDGTAYAVVSGGTAPYAYAWTGGNTADSLTNALNGNYTVLVTDAHNCSDSANLYLPFIHLAPASGLVQNKLFCDADSAVIAANPGYAQYLWNTGDSLPHIVVTQSGVYALTITSEAGCATSDSTHVTFASSTPVSLGPDSVICIDQGPVTFNLQTMPTGFSSYAWNTGDTTSTISVSSTGIYKVTVSNAASCLSSDMVILAFDTCRNVSVDELAANTGLLLYPNPTRNKVELRWKQLPSQDVGYTLMNSQGALVQTYISAEIAVEFDLSNLASGMYFLRVENGRGTQLLKVLKQ